MKRNSSFVYCIIITMFVFLISPGGASAEDSDEARLKVLLSGSSVVDKTASVKIPTGIKAMKASDTSLKLIWKKVAGASGYTVYKWDLKAKKYKAIKTLTGNSKITWTDKKLKSNVTYKYKVRAFKKASGEKKYGGYSQTVSARAFTNKAKTVNVKSIQVDYTVRYLGLNSVKKIPASVVVPKGKKPLGKSLTWKSSNPTIVKVNKYGWIEAQGKPGKAKIVIRSHNGVTRTLAITVADYARPVQFSDLDKVKLWNAAASSVLTKYQHELTAIAAWLERFKKEIRFLYKDGSLHYLYGTIPYDSIESELEDLLKNTSAEVWIKKGEVFFMIPPEENGYFGATIVFTDDNRKDNRKEGKIKIAPCWYFIDDRNNLD